MSDIQNDLAICGWCGTDLSVRPWHDPLYCANQAATFQGIKIPTELLASADDYPQ